VRHLQLNFETDGERFGYWHDEVNAKAKVVSTYSPASALYHLIGALIPLIQKIETE